MIFIFYSSQQNENYSSFFQFFSFLENVDFGVFEEKYEV